MSDIILWAVIVLALIIGIGFIFAVAKIFIFGLLLGFGATLISQLLPSKEGIWKYIYWGLVAILVIILGRMFSGTFSLTGIIIGLLLVPVISFVYKVFR